MRILHIDDDRDVRQSVRRSFEDHAHEMHEAQNPIEAMKLLDEGLSPDLIICDLDMPRMTGEQFLAVRAATPRIAAIPLVILSGDKAIGKIAARYGVQFVDKGRAGDLALSVVALLHEK